MGQITSGIRAILSRPWVYDALQNIMGAKSTRRDLVDNFMRPTAGTQVLDIGCGTAEILPFLPEGVRYWGYDISRDYIDAARKRFGDRGRFECRLLNWAELSELPKFDTVIATGVLHHMDDPVAAEIFEVARAALARNGRMITIDPCLAPGQNPIARRLILSDRGQNVRDAGGYRRLAERSFSQVEGTLRHRRWIPYTHWIMTCSA